MKLHILIIFLKIFNFILLDIYLKTCVSKIFTIRLTEQTYITYLKNDTSNSKRFDVNLYFKILLSFRYNTELLIVSFFLELKTQYVLVYSIFYLPLINALNYLLNLFEI